MTTTRRDFLQMAGAAATLLPALIERAMAIPAQAGSGSIQDVKHIVVLMQENRSFDHYFGTLNGVRGFGDPRPPRLAGGRSVWAQPSKQHGDGHVLPFHGDSTTTRAFAVDGAEQSHQENLHIFNRGRCDRWGHSGELHNRMLYYTAGDLPFYYALADAFTICDAYHCSTMTQTQPNRLHLFTGCNGGGSVGGEPEMSNYGEDDTLCADMAEDRKLRRDAFRWTTYAERLQSAGIRWKVYQEYDNFGDNTMSFFPAFRGCSRESDLYLRGRSWVSESQPDPDRTRSDGEQLVAAFRRDIEGGRLPQISWIVPSADLSEHPKAAPARGEHLCARLIEALVDNPGVFAQTVFILNYDEAGGFFDHAIQPVPPIGDYRGRSTVPVDGELKDYTGDNVLEQGKHPIGLGIRTPMIVVSPWSRGGFVCSELFDHTSVIRFMERCFGVSEPNISAWRRSVCGDLTSCFDFNMPEAKAAPALPSTADFHMRIARSHAGRATGIPSIQSATAQMPGQRLHRPLPYDLDVVAMVTPQRRLRIELTNRGPTGAVVTVHDNRDLADPWHYTVGAHDQLISEQWHEDGPLDAYDLTVRGPNGLWQRAAGSLSPDAPRARVWLVPRPADDAVDLVLRNDGSSQLAFTIALDEHYPSNIARRRTVRVAAGAETREHWPLSKSDHWYDFAITIDAAPSFLRRFAGKIETGRAGRTDPAIGAMRLTV